MTIPLHASLEEAAHARIAKRLGCSNIRVFLSEEGGHVTAELPPAFSNEQRAWHQLLIGLAGLVVRAIHFGRDPFDALDGPISVADRLAINQGVGVLGKKAKNCAILVLDTGLREDWEAILELGDALENPEPNPPMPIEFATPTRKGGETVSGPMVMTLLPKFPDVKPRRNRVQALLSEDLSLPSLPSWDEVQPKKRFGVFETREKTKKITRDPHGEIVSIEETGPLGLDKLAEAFGNLTHSLESAVLDAVKPRRTRKLIKRDAFGDIESISEEELQ